MPTPQPDIGEGPIVQGARDLSPEDVEEITQRWNKVCDSPEARVARAAAIHALPAGWGTSKLRVMSALDDRRRELGDDLPWESVRAAALDALRAVLAKETVSDETYATLTEAWGDVRRDL
jgi:hypothetical protein